MLSLFYTNLGSGTPLVILHGLLGSSDNWATLARKWQSDFNVIAIDQRNHGKSPHSEVFNYRAMAEDVKQVLDELKISKAVLLGHSMGGKVAMFFSHRYPERTQGLIIVDISPRFYPVHHRAILEAMHRLEPERFSRIAEATEAFAESGLDYGTRAFILKNLKRNESGQLSWKINLNGIQANIEEVGVALPNGAYFNGPSCFVRGGASKYVPDEDLELILRIFPNAQWVTVPDAGHWVHADNPTALSEIVYDFMRRIS
jgi:esterase